MLVEALSTYLAADSGLQSQLGVPTARGGNTGIFPVIAPDQSVVPYLVMQQISGDPLQVSMQGTGRLQTERWRFSCHGSTYKQAKKLAKQLSVTLEAFNGEQAAPGNCVIQGAWKKLEADDAEPIPHGTLYTTHVDFEFNYIDLDF